jgi:hypothetical protein
MIHGDGFSNWPAAVAMGMAMLWVWAFLDGTTRDRLKAIQGFSSLW